MTTLAFADRVQEFAQNVGSGSVSLQGSTDVKLRTFAQAGLDGKTVTYVIVHRSTTQWEVGIGVYTAASTTLTRAAVLSNSLGTTALVPFSAGFVDVWNDLPAEKVVALAADSNTLTLPGAMVVGPNPGVYSLGPGAIGLDAAQGLVLVSNAGTVNDFMLMAPNGDNVMSVRNGVLTFNGEVFTTNPVNVGGLLTASGGITSPGTVTAASFVGSLAWTSVTGHPTTLAGYGITDAQSATGPVAWSRITAPPTTLAGYGITDAAPAAGPFPWAGVTGHPTTLAGYGITDAVQTGTITAPMVGAGTFPAGVFTFPTGLTAQNTVRVAVGSVTSSTAQMAVIGTADASPIALSIGNQLGTGMVLSSALSGGAPTQLLLNPTAVAGSGGVIVGVDPGSTQLFRVGGGAYISAANDTTLTTLDVRNTNASFAGTVVNIQPTVQTSAVWPLRVTLPTLGGLPFAVRGDGVVIIGNDTGNGVFRLRPVGGDLSVIVASIYGVVMLGAQPTGGQGVIALTHQAAVGPNRFHILFSGAGGNMATIGGDGSDNLQIALQGTRSLVVSGPSVFQGNLTAQQGVTLSPAQSGGLPNPGIFNTSAGGISVRGAAGTSWDFVVYNSGLATVFGVAAGSTNVQFFGPLYIADATSTAQTTLDVRQSNASFAGAIGNFQTTLSTSSVTLLRAQSNAAYFGVRADGPTIVGGDTGTGVLRVSVGAAANTTALSVLGMTILNANPPVANYTLTLVNANSTAGTGSFIGFQVPAGVWVGNLGTDASNNLTMSAAGAGRTLRLGSSSNPVVIGNDPNPGGTEILRVGGVINITSAAQGTLTVASSSSGNDAAYITHSGASPFGAEILFTAASGPNNGTNYFLHCADTQGTRINLLSNGGVANYSANNVNLSDATLKQVGDTLDGADWYERLAQIPIRRFKYLDQSDEDWNIGLVAQDVEAVAPELVDEMPHDHRMVKAVYTTDLYHAHIAVTQELQRRLAALDAKIAQVAALHSN